MTFVWSLYYIFTSEYLSQSIYTPNRYQKLLFSWTSEEKQEDSGWWEKGFTEMTLQLQWLIDTTRWRQWPDQVVAVVQYNHFNFRQYAQSTSNWLLIDVEICLRHMLCYKYFTEEKLLRLLGLAFNDSLEYCDYVGNTWTMFIAQCAATQSSYIIYLFILKHIAFFLVMLRCISLVILLISNVNKKKWDTVADIVRSHFL